MGGFTAASSEADSQTSRCEMEMIAVFVAITTATGAITYISRKLIMRRTIIISVDPDGEAKVMEVDHIVAQEAVIEAPSMAELEEL